MKIINSSVSVLVQQPGVIGLKKHVEIVGRLSHLSGDKITDDSYVKFLDVIKTNGHFAVLDLGTVYLRIPEKDIREMDCGWLDKIIYNPWTRVAKDSANNDNLITTTYRLIVRYELEYYMEKYWCDPTEEFYQRATAFFVCSRNTANQLVRHASLRPNQESQRFNNYSRDKFDGEITFIIPEWFKDSNVGKAKERRVKSWKSCEDNYMEDIKDGLKAEDARGSLSGDAKTSLYMCGYLSDWYMKPIPGSNEKTGFFFLRSAKDAQRDVRVLSQELETLFKKHGYNRLK